MKFERLKRSYKREIIMGVLAICIIGSILTFATTKAKYKLTQSIDLVKGTINYKPYDFKIMAMYKSDDENNYTEINEMPSEGYVINGEKTYCTIDNKTKVKGKIKTENGKHYITGLSKSDKCYLYFDKGLSPSEETLEKLNITNVKEETPDFSKTATTDEGIYKVEDGMYGGYSYYWRGATTNNYVKFAGFCWRIVRINGDGTIRLIYDGSTCHANGESTTDSLAVTNQAYNPSRDRSEYVGWTYSTGSQRTTSGTASNAKTQLESWYSTNITGTNLTKAAEGKFCNDRDVVNEVTWNSTGTAFNYSAGRRLYTDHQPTLSCPSGDMYTLNVGLITADEVALAGNSIRKENQLYYLYNGQKYWTMTPYLWDPAYAYVFNLYHNGMLDWSSVYSGFGLRPVINLKSDTKFQSDGNGTLSNPYVVS